YLRLADEGAAPPVGHSIRAEMGHSCRAPRNVVEEIAEVETPYPYRQEWDEESSPLGLEFSADDPARQGWGLSDGSDSAPPDADFLVENGYLPPEEVSVAVPTNWINALTLVVHGEDAGVCALIQFVGTATETSS